MDRNKIEEIVKDKNTLKVSVYDIVPQRDFLQKFKIDFSKLSCFLVDKHVLQSNGYPRSYGIYIPLAKCILIAKKINTQDIDKWRFSAKISEMKIVAMHQVAHFVSHMVFHEGKLIENGDQEQHTANMILVKYLVHIGKQMQQIVDILLPFFAQQIDLQTIISNNIKDVKNDIQSLKEADIRAYQKCMQQINKYALQFIQICLQQE